MPARRPVAFLTCLLVLAAPPQAAAEVDAESAQDFIRAANRAYGDGDLAMFTGSLERAISLNPFSLATQYNLACAYALTGRDDDAYDLLERLVAQRVDYGMAADDDLATLRGSDRFAALVAKLDERTAPVNASSVAQTIAQLDLVPEGIAIDPQTGRTFVSSMRNGDILVFDEHGNLTKFATVAHEGTLAAIGLYADVARGTLWAAGATFDVVEGFDPDAPVRSGLFGFDLATGKPTRKLIAPAAVNGFNDVTVGPDGTLYASGDALSVVRPGSDVIEALPVGLRLYGSNGVAVTADGRQVFTSAYPVGIAVVDVASGDARWLDAPDDVTLYGIDGLYWHDGALIGVQNGTRPWRLVRLHLNAARTAVTGVDYLEFANPDIVPTTGAIVDGRIFYVGQGPRPDSVPDHVAPEIAQFLGKTIVMVAPLH